MTPGAKAVWKAPASAPEVSWKASRAETGLATPWAKVGPVGDWPRAMRAWMTRAVELGSVDCGLPGELG